MERNHYHTRGGGSSAQVEPDLLFRWGSWKRLRCVKTQRKDEAPEKTTTVRVDRRVVRSDKDSAPLTHPIHQRVLRNSEAAAAMKESTGGSPARAAANCGGPSGSSEGAAAHEKKCAGGSSSGSEGAVLPNLAIALTNKEKEDDFMAFKGSKLPLRPKKRPKLIQKTLNLVSPGAWLGDLTQERYEVREKKISKKRPRGLKAMGDMESDSE